MKHFFDEYDEFDELDETTELLKDFKPRMIDEDDIEDLSDLLAEFSYRDKTNDNNNREYIPIYKDNEAEIPVYDDFDNLESVDNSKIDMSPVIEASQSMGRSRSRVETREKYYNSKSIEIDDDYGNKIPSGYAKVEHELDKYLMDKKKAKQLGKRLMMASGIFLPGIIVLLIISIHTNYLIRDWLQYLIILSFGIGLFLFIMGLVKYTTNRKVKDIKRLKKWMMIVLGVFYSTYIIGCTSFILLLYGPFHQFRNWLITTAMQTMNHQYLCKWFYSSKEIDKVLSENFVKESGDSTNTDLVDTSGRKEPVTYENEYEEAVLKKDKGNDLYKIIELEVNGMNAYLAVIYDPSKVRVAVTKELGTRGQYVTKMAEINNSALAINAGGFYDPGASSLGGTPTGITIVNGKVITNNEYGVSGTGGLIGFTDDNKLVLLKATSASQALSKGVRDAVSWGPFLIVNGEPSFISGNGGWGYAARTAIGQRADGIVLMLVVDSNTSRTKGASMVDLTEIMQRYGAINAANLDGGTSSVMALPKDIAVKKYNSPCNDYFTNKYCAINDPVDSTGAHRTRYIATSFIVDK